MVQIRYRTKQTAVTHVCYLYNYCSTRLNAINLNKCIFIFKMILTSTLQPRFSFFFFFFFSFIPSNWPHFPMSSPLDKVGQRLQVIFSINYPPFSCLRQEKQEKTVSLSSNRCVSLRTARKEETVPPPH